MPCKSVFLLQNISKNLNYYDNLKLGREGGKIILLGDEKKHGGGGGGPSRTIA